MYHILLYISLLILFVNAEKETEFKTTIENATKSDDLPKIDYKILRTPHHLFIGRCNPIYEIVHQEHIVVKNDGKSHVGGKIRVNIEGPINITCVNIYDEMDEESAYPTYDSGGVGYNYISFNVQTRFGQGFHFFIQIYGQNNN